MRICSWRENLLQDFYPIFPPRQPELQFYINERLLRLESGTKAFNLRLMRSQKNGALKKKELQPGCCHS